MGLSEQWVVFLLWLTSQPEERSCSVVRWQQGGYGLFISFGSAQTPHPPLTDANDAPGSFFILLQSLPVLQL